MLCLVRSKACKRCGGDISLECDIYGVYAECIQCGANWSIQERKQPTNRSTQKRSKPITAEPTVAPGKTR